jgi:hypothetical protein
MKWKKLTIMDLLLLMVAYAVAGGVMSANEHHFHIHNWSRLEVFFSIILGGNSTSVAVVLPAQYLVRRRRTRLSEGELLWVVEFVVASLGAAMVSVSPVASWCLLFVFILICPLLGLVCLYFRLLGKWGWTTCRWTDIFGCSNCVCNAIYLICGFVAHPPQI